LPNAEILTIGTELLLGEILDTNAQHLARTLRDVGVDLLWHTTVGDNPARIEQAIRQALGRSDITLMTGGLGPTVDDMTREAAARALGVDLEYRPELWAEIEAWFAGRGKTPGENNRRQAFIPRGGTPISNPVGTAPCFAVERAGRVVVALPGVPRAMVHLVAHAVLPYLGQRFDLSQVIRVRVLNTRGVGESVIDARIGDLETWSNPTVGLAAHAGKVDIRLTAKAASSDAATAMLDALEAEVRRRLADWVIGVDGEPASAGTSGG
jgi:competence/damage-inducible protein CinA-like protein